jgi:DNA mismatch repair ATPase MutS
MSQDYETAKNKNDKIYPPRPVSETFIEMEENIRTELGVDCVLIQHGDFFGAFGISAHYLRHSLGFHIFSTRRGLEAGGPVWGALKTIQKIEALGGCVAIVEQIEPKTTRKYLRQITYISGDSPSNLRLIHSRKEQEKS